jgi:signal transduction histidine kinase/DNA-binding response OmpR family regulator/ligand-binding sensor domain-containing protein
MVVVQGREVPDMERKIKCTVVVLLVTISCLPAFGDRSWAAERRVADWTLDPDERSARLRRLTQGRLADITQAAGFSSRYVYEFDQDDQGFIWVGTRNGLDRFDGYEVRNYRREPDSEGGLSSSDIRTLAVAADGIVWVGSHAEGLDRFDSATGKATSFRNKPGDPHHIGDDYISDITVSNGGSIWVGTRVGGLSHIDDETLEVKRFHMSAGESNRIPGDDIKAIFEDFDGRIWVGTDRGLIVANNADTGFTTVNLSAFGLAGPIVVRAIQQDSTQTLYLLANEVGLLEVQLDGDSISSVQAIGTDWILDYDPASLMLDSADRLWIGGDPYRIYDTVAKKLHSVPIVGVVPFEDHSGIIWFSTQPDIARLDPELLVFGDIKEELASSTGVSRLSPFAVLETGDGSVWMSTAFGVWRRHPDLSTFTEYVVPANEAANFPNDTNALYEDRKGIIWAGMFNVGINRIDPASGQIKNFPLCELLNADDLCNRVWVIDGDAQGRIWVGSADGFYFFDAESGAFQPVIVSDRNANTAIGGGVRSLAFGKNNVIWIGTENGLLQWSQDSDKWMSFVNDPTSANGLVSNFINSLHEDDEGMLWIATPLGANRLDPETGQFATFNTTTGLPNNDIQTVIEDDYGKIWMSTGEGLTTLDRKTFAVRVLDKSDGLASEEFLLGSAYAGRSGNVYFGGEDTMLYFDPAMLTVNDTPPKMVFTALRINNEIVIPEADGSESILQAPLNRTESITLPYELANITVEFAGIHFSDPQQNRYAYQLVGYDNDWIFTDSNRRSASYTNLPFGNYTLRVKAANRDGIWNEAGRSIAITVLTPYWRTWWAYLLYVIAATMTLMFIIWLRTRALSTRAELLEKTVDQRTREIRQHEQLIQSQADELSALLGLKEKWFTNISHEFRTPLTLILGPADRLLQSDITGRQASHAQLIKQNGQRLLRLVDQLLDLARLDAEEPRVLSPQSMSHAVNLIAESFLPLIETRELEFERNVEDHLWVSASVSDFERILMNLLSNALKYTPKGGDISVTLTGSSDYVLLVVSDSGVGIPVSRQEAIFERFSREDNTGENIPGAGIGLALVREIVEALNGSIDLKSKPGEGTSVKVALPRCPQPETTPVDLQRGALSESVTGELESLMLSQNVFKGLVASRGLLKPNVLIVEDNPDLQNYLIELLSPSYCCTVARDGVAGLNMSQEEVPDLILCDVMLPKMDGYTLCNRLKSDERTSHIPIIMLTARGDHDSRLLGLREKVDAYLAKPFDDEELLLRIKTILGAREILRTQILKQIFENGDPRSGLGGKDRKVIDRLNKTIEAHLADSLFEITAMASEMAMSERALQRKLKALTGQTPVQYLRKYRLRKSVALLRDGMPVNLAAESVGFSSPAYFTSRFREEFGESPTRFVGKTAP